MAQTNHMIRSFLASALLFGLGVSACAPPPLPPRKKAKVQLTDPSIDHDRGVDPGKARKLLARAEVALIKRDLASMKRFTEQAEPFADEAVREEIRDLLQRADRSVAKDAAPAILELAKTGQCQKAAEETARIGDANRGKAVSRFLRDEVSKAILGCVLDALAIDVSVARELAEIGAIKKALHTIDFDQWEARLDETIVGSLVASLKATIASRNWPKAVRELDDMVERKEAGPRDVARVMKVIRGGIVDDVLKKSSAGVGVKIGASALLKDIDAMIDAGRWSEAEPMPDALRERSEEVALWAICAAQDCTLSVPQAMWANGLLEPKPTLDLAGSVSQRIKHGRKVWRLTEGRGLVLIADRDPGVLDGVGARIPVALGWVPAASLAASDTSDRLPPGDAIVGTRVWGPLRGPTKEWELGVVRETKGDSLTIERISDGKNATLRRAEVRFGLVRPGLKVLALCVHAVKLEAALVEEVVPMSPGDPHVRLTCLDGKGERTEVKREVLLGSLRSQASFMPPGS